MLPWPWMSCPYLFGGMVGCVNRDASQIGVGTRPSVCRCTKKLKRDDKNQSIIGHRTTENHSEDGEISRVPPSHSGPTPVPKILRPDDTPKPLTLLLNNIKKPIPNFDSSLKIYRSPPPHHRRGQFFLMVVISMKIAGETRAEPNRPNFPSIITCWLAHLLV